MSEIMYDNINVYFRGTCGTDRELLYMDCATTFPYV